MELMKSENEPTNIYEEMIEKVVTQIVSWKGILDYISEHRKSDVKPQFHQIQAFVMDRLTSFASVKNQGYVMHGFELDSEMASYLFLDPSDGDVDINNDTKPDYVIIMNRLLDQDNLCAELEMNEPSIDETPSPESEAQRELKAY